MFLLLLLLATLSFTQVAVGDVTCNACVSEMDPDCDSVLSYNPPTCNGVSCVTFTGTADGARIVARSCRKREVTGCSNVDYEADGVRYVGTVCSCVTDYCNGGKIERSNSTGISAATRTPASGQRVTCYKCSSVIDSRNCGDELIVSPNIQTCTGVSCVIVSGTVDGKYVVGRECSERRVPTGCSRTTSARTDQRTVDGTVCYCNSDRCNTDGAVHPVLSGGNSFRGVISLIMSALFGSLLVQVFGVNN